MCSRHTVVVGVVGGGLMGCGIASKFASSGFDAFIYDNAPGARDRIEAGCGAIFWELTTASILTAHQAEAARQRIHVVEGIDGLRQCELIVEAIFESLSAKQAIYAALEAAVLEDTIIASSTSGIPPTQLCARMQRPERFLVAHYWNPPHIIPLVEVVPNERSDDNVVQETMQLLKDSGSDPVLLNKAVPGFIGNRIQFAVLREALHLLQLGVADAATIDNVMKQSLGRRYRWIGPLEGADLGGLETFLTISTQLMPELAKGEHVLELLRSYVDRGEMGRLSGQGIYQWDMNREQQFQNVRQSMLGDLAS